MHPSLTPIVRSEALTTAYLEENGILPLEIAGGRLKVATCQAELDLQVADDLRVLFGGEPELVPVSRDELLEAIQRGYGGAPETVESLIAGLGSHDPVSPAEAGTEDLRHMANQAPVVRLVGLILSEALEARASDVHLEHVAEGLSVRYRIDGVLTGAPSPPAALSGAVVGRIKVMAGMDVAERRRPQDGRFRMRLPERSVDVRASTLPALHGESVVLRLLDQERSPLNLGGLGMDAGSRREFEVLCRRPHGVLLVTGPTGSGKTTTLYAALARIRTGREKVLTVEDPVEYALDGVVQVPVNRKADVTFASALRSILRQDPDILLVGEMRDPETAEISVQAALTGHLVLSTLHTNDAPGALVRLLELGVEPYLVTSSVIGVLAQRLVRLVCPRCAVETALPEETTEAMAACGVPCTHGRRGSGCSHCRGSGYLGRTGIYELLVVDEDIRREILRRRGASPLRALALRSGMRPLRADGWRQVAAGSTTPEEVLRVTQA